MTKTIKVISALVILMGMAMAFGATIIMVILPDWWSFTAGMIGFLMIGIGAVAFKLLDNK